jgi:hypothetical protein
MLAGIQAMLRHSDILQGCRFTWVTDHKGLIHLVNQKNLSGRQARWIEKISSFNFEIQYIPGPEIFFADALSRIYSNEAPGTVRARSEYTYHDVVNNNDLDINSITMPVFAGLEAMALSSDRVTRTMTRKAADARSFASDSRTSAKEGGGTQKPSSSAHRTENPNTPEKTSKSSKVSISLIRHPQAMPKATAINQFGPSSILT